MKRWIWLAMSIAIGATVAALATDTPIPTVEPEEAVKALPRFDEEVELGETGMVPYRIRIPKDHEVHLIFRAGPDAEKGMLAITGYENQVPPFRIGPGEADEVVFTTELPGDDFAVTLDETVLGRIEVTGDHLEDGHQ